MKGKKGPDFQKTLVSATGLVVLLAILILINVILSYANIRWDATEDKIYSLSKGTKNILSSLTQTVTVKFFYNKSERNLPANQKLYAKRVREFLSEYKNMSKGKIKIEFYDPKPDSDEEEWAQKYGLRPMQLGTGSKIYSGLVFVAADQEETIPWLDPTREELLEYDITRIIQRLQSYKRKTIGIISPLPVFGAPQQMAVPGRPPTATPWFFITELKKTYEVKAVDLTATTIDADVDLLILLHPKDLSQTLQYAVDQYVLSGGNAMIFVDPFCVSDASQGRQAMFQPPQSNMEKLFKAWGITMDATKALADMDHPTRVRGQGNRVENSPVWITLRKDTFNHSDVVTSRLESMLFPIAGAIKKTEDSSYDFEPMVQSGKNAALVESFKASFGTASIRRDFSPADERFTLVARLQGRFKTAFPAGAPKAESDDKSKQKETSPKASLKEAKESATIIVVADADMMADQFYVQKSRILGFTLSKMFNDNLNFVANACEILTGSDDLIGLRSRGTFERPFTAVMELERQAQERWLAKEKELVKRADETNTKLRQLQQQKDTSQKLILSAEQEAEIAKFREEKSRINRELKQVRKNLRADVEALGNTLSWINILLMPLCVSIAGIGFAIFRQRRMKEK